MDIGGNEAMMLRSINNKRIGPTKDLSLITWRATKLKGGGVKFYVYKKGKPTQL